MMCCCAIAGWSVPTVLSNRCPVTRVRFTFNLYTTHTSRLLPYSHFFYAYSSGYFYLIASNAGTKCRIKRSTRMKIDYINITLRRDVFNWFVRLLWFVLQQVTMYVWWTVDCEWVTTFLCTGEFNDCESCSELELFIICVALMVLVYWHLWLCMCVCIVC